MIAVVYVRYVLGQRIGGHRVGRTGQESVDVEGVDGITSRDQEVGSPVGVPVGKNVVVGTRRTDLGRCVELALVGIGYFPYTHTLIVCHGQIMTAAMSEEGQVSQIATRWIPGSDHPGRGGVGEADGHHLGSVSMFAGYEYERPTCFLVQDDMTGASSKGFETGGRGLRGLHASKGEMPGKLHIAATAGTVLTPGMRIRDEHTHHEQADDKGRKASHGQLGLAGWIGLNGLHKAETGIFRLRRRSGNCKACVKGLHALLESIKRGQQRAEWETTRSKDSPCWFVA